MDENRFPRPGPGMVIMFAVIGLIVGIFVGLFNAAGTRQEPSQVSGDESTTTRQAAALPDRFFTVVLASVPRSRDRSVAEGRAEAFRAEGVDHVGVLDPIRFTSLADGFWAVYSGVFETRREAADHRDELRSRFPDLASAYLKLVSSQS